MAGRVSRPPAAQPLWRRFCAAFLLQAKASGFAAAVAVIGYFSLGEVGRSGTFIDGMVDLARDADIVLQVFAIAFCLSLVCTAPYPFLLVWAGSRRLRLTVTLLYQAAWFSYGFHTIFVLGMTEPSLEVNLAALSLLPLSAAFLCLHEWRMAGRFADPPTIRG